MKSNKRFSTIPKLTLLMAIVFSLMFGGSASAFHGVKGDKEHKAVERLEKLGMIKGDFYDRINPAQKINGATAVSLIVATLDLNFDTIRFIKMPKASDYYTKVKDNAWYSEAFVIARYYGLDIPKDINPSAKVTKEQFSHWLFQALSEKGEFMWTMQYIEIKDSKQINDSYMDSIQKLLKADIVTLDKNKNFLPNQPVSLSEAAGMLERTLQFIEDSEPVANPVYGNLYDFELDSDKISGDIKKVTISAMAPHPGYGLEVAGIEFKEGKAIIDYRILKPEQGKFYPQVISEVQAVTYIPADYKAVLGAQAK